MPDPSPLAERGVYRQPYLLHGRREYFAVDSKGEQIATRLVREGADPSRAIEELWEELNEVDAIPSHLSPPSLRLMR